MSNGNRKKRRLVRAAAACGIILTVAAVLLTAVWAVLNCSEKYAERLVSSSLNGTLSIGDMRFSYPFNIVISQIRLNFPDSTFFAADRVSADINIGALVRRHISVNSLHIANPVFSKTAVMPKVPGPADPTGPAGSQNKPATPFPWKLDLSEISISSCAVSFPLAQDSSVLSIAGISLDVTGLRTITNDPIPKSLTGSAVIWADSGSVLYKKADTSMLFRLTASVSLSLKQDLEIDISGFAGLFPGSSKTGFYVKAAGNSGPGFHTVQIDTLSLCLGAARLIHASGSVNHSPPNPTSYDISIEGDAVDIAAVQDFAGPIAAIPPGFSGTLKPIQGNISGTAANPQARLSWGARDLNAALTPMAGMCRELTFLACLDSMENREIRGSVTISARGITMRMPDSSSFFFPGLSVSADTQLDTAFRPVTAHIQGRIDSLFSGTVSITGTADKVYDPAESRAAVTLSADSLALHQIAQNFPVLGTASCSTQIYAEGYNSFSIKVAASSPGLVLLLPSDTLTIPNVTTDMAFTASSSDSGDWDITGGTIDALQSVHIPFTARVSSRGASADVRGAAVDLSLLYSLLQDVDGLESPDIDLAGTLGADFQVSTKASAVTGSGAILLDSTWCRFHTDSLLLQDIHSRITFDFNEESADITGHVSCGSAHIPGIRPEPLILSSADFRAGMMPGKTRLDTLTLSLDNSLVTGGMSGHAGNNNFSAHCLVNFQADTFTHEIAAMYTRGTASVSCTVNSMGDTVAVTGTALADSFYVSLGPSINVRNLYMDVPFSLELFPQSTVEPSLPGRFITSRLPDYTAMRTIYMQTCPEIGSIRADSISVKTLAVSQPVIDIIIGGGTVHIPFFGASAMGGTVGGSLVISAENMQRQSVSYVVNGQFSDIDASYISGVGGGENTIINATASISGRGIDPDKGIDINGYFSISDIGSQVASALLKGIDPSGTDKSIKITQRLIRTGWKPQLFSFDLKHGYMYPSLSLSQPWFSPVRIPDNLEYGRIPVAFFIENMKTNKKEPDYEE